LAISSKLHSLLSFRFSGIVIVDDVQIDLVEDLYGRYLLYWRCFSILTNLCCGI